MEQLTITNILNKIKQMHLRYLKDASDAMMILYPQSIIDVQWWYNNINSSKIILRKVNLLLKFHLMLVVLGGELSATTFALDAHLTLLK